MNPWRFVVIFSNGKKFFVQSISTAFKLVDSIKSEIHFRDLTFRIENEYPRPSREEAERIVKAFKKAYPLLNERSNVHN